MSNRTWPARGLFNPLIAALALASLTACGGGSDDAGSAVQQDDAATLQDAAPATTPSSQAQSVEAALADGMGSINVTSSACSNGNCALTAEVSFDVGQSGVLQNYQSRLTSMSSTSGLGLTVTVFVLESGAWVAETWRRSYTLQPDNRLTLSGGRYGPNGLTGQLQTRDLAGTALASWPGIPAGTVGTFPAGATAFSLQGEVAAPRYRLTVYGVAFGSTGLEDYVAHRQTPAEGQPPDLLVTVNADNPAQLAYTFDAPLATEGVVTVWRATTAGHERLGAGRYAVGMVEGQQLLTFNELGVDVLARLDRETVARYTRGERHIVGTANGATRAGTYLPAGPDATTQLNRIAIDALLVAMGMPPLTPAVLPLPVGGRIYDGTTPSTLPVLVAGGDVSIDWSTFNVGGGGSVTISNGSGQYVNGGNPTGSVSTAVGGTLVSNGTQFAVEPNGITNPGAGAVLVAEASTVDLVPGTPGP